MRKNAEGHEVPKGGPGAPVTAWQQDIYIADGKGVETFIPRFTFHGFRYMEISGLEKAPDAADLRAFPLRTDVPDAGSFACSNEDLNRIQEMCRRTFLANIMTVQSDCPHRERFGYGGDIVATSEAYMMNFDMAGFYAKTVRDWGDAARPDGRLTDTAPFVGIDYCGVGWAMVHPLLIEQLYQHYGDKALMEEQLPLAVRWLDIVADGRKEGLVIGGLGDHEALVPSKGPEFLTAMFIDTAKRIARLSRILGNEKDATRFNKIAAESTKAWKEKYFDEATGKIGKGNQSAQAFALGFNAAPADIQEAVFNQLVADLTAPEDSPRLTTGIYGTHILLEQLSRNGRSDLAYGLADRKTFPSWNWMLENGATTLWEHWAEDADTYSHNHPMFGSISNWFFRWLGGIQCAPDAVGFNHVLIRPQIVGDLEWVKSSHDSIRGTITSNWSASDTERSFEILIPTGVKATVELPINQGTTLTEGGKPLSEHSEIKVLEGGPELQRMELGSGAYRFKAK
jgi:alpha-L-rhamnosidase